MSKPKGELKAGTGELVTWRSGWVKYAGIVNGPDYWWMCPHRHYSQEAAQQCAERHRTEVLERGKTHAT